MKKEEMTPKQLWRLAQKYNESDFVKILGEIAQLKQEEPREEEKPTRDIVTDVSYRNCHWCGGIESAMKTNLHLWTECVLCGRQESF